MRWFMTLLLAVLVPGVLTASEPVAISSPGFAPSHFEPEGRLVESWGSVKLRITGEGLQPEETSLRSIMLSECVPAACWTARFGPVLVGATAYRAPIFPGGMDVLCVELEETAGQSRQLTLGLEISPQARTGFSTARVEDRVVLSIPVETQQQLQANDWGYTIDTTPMPGWAKPEGECDPAFANIRAGMGGIPIRYRFRVEPGSKAQVILGICESYHSRLGSRPILCMVEGARPVLVDPLERWGRHKPGVLPFAAADVSGDGWLSLSVQPVAGAPDHNPILNVIWVFPGDERPNLNRVVAGQLSDQARYYVDVGGARDQPAIVTDGMQFPLELVPSGTKRLTFYVACGDGSAVVPELTAWTTEGLYRAAVEVWQAWSRSTAKAD